jgi:hypothetical protein
MTAHDHFVFNCILWGLFALGILAEGWVEIQRRRLTDKFVAEYMAKWRATPPKEMTQEEIDAYCDCGD